jgi:hypothetical protein
VLLRQLLQPLKSVAHLVVLVHTQQPLLLLLLLLCFLLSTTSKVCRLLLKRPHSSVNLPCTVGSTAAAAAAAKTHRRDRSC